jgi:hypothetical protein
MLFIGEVYNFVHTILNKFKNMIDSRLNSENI